MEIRSSVQSRASSFEQGGGEFPFRFVRDNVEPGAQDSHVIGEGLHNEWLVRIVGYIEDGFSIQFHATFPSCEDGGIFDA